MGPADQHNTRGGCGIGLYHIITACKDARKDLRGKLEDVGKNLQNVHEERVLGDAWALKWGMGGWGGLAEWWVQYMVCCCAVTSTAVRTKGSGAREADGKTHTTSSEYGWGCL